MAWTLQVGNVEDCDGAKPASLNVCEASEGDMTKLVVIIGADEQNPIGTCEK